MYKIIKKYLKIMKIRVKLLKQLRGTWGHFNYVPLISSFFYKFPNYFHIYTYSYQPSTKGLNDRLFQFLWIKTNSHVTHASRVANGVECPPPSVERELVGLVGSQNDNAPSISVSDFTPASGASL